MRFKDRKDAGLRLAEMLYKYKGSNTVIYALPRGGVILGLEIGKILNAPLDLIITRKIGHPDNPEYAVCAITEDGELFCNESERATLNEKRLMEQVEKVKFYPKHNPEFLFLYHYLIL